MINLSKKPDNVSSMQNTAQIVAVSFKTNIHESEKSGYDIWGKIGYAVPVELSVQKYISHHQTQFHRNPRIEHFWKMEMKAGKDGKLIIYAVEGEDYCGIAIFVQTQSAYDKLMTLLEKIEAAKAGKTERKNFAEAHRYLSELWKAAKSEGINYK